MSARTVAGTWDCTYRRAHLGDHSELTSVEIITAISDHMTLVSDLEINIHAPGGRVDMPGCRAKAGAAIRLSAQEMRELSALLPDSANRVDELEQMRRRLLAEQAQVPA